MQWDWDWITGGVAVLSLLLSGWLAFTQRWEKRQAFIEVRLEVYVDPTVFSDKSNHREWRLVLVNHGPAVARDVDVRLTPRDGSAARHDALRLNQHVLPIPILWPGQDVHLPLLTAMGADIFRAELEWRDGRSRRHAAEVFLTKRFVR